MPASILNTNESFVIHDCHSNSALEMFFKPPAGADEEEAPNYDRSSKYWPFTKAFRQYRPSPD